MGDVPVHIDHAHRQRDAAGLELGHQVEVLLLGIFPIARPPVAQGPARDERHLARHAAELAQAAQVVVPEAKQIEVQVFGVGALGDPALIIENQGVRIIHQGPALARHQARVEAHRAVDAVQGAGRAHQVGAAAPGAVTPDYPAGQYLDGKRPGAEAGGGDEISQPQVLGADFDPLRAALHRKSRHRLFAVPKSLAGMVLKFAGRAVFQAEQARSEHGKAHVGPGNHRLWGSGGSEGQLELGRNRLGHGISIDPLWVVSILYPTFSTQSTDVKL